MRIDEAPLEQNILSALRQSEGGLAQQELLEFGNSTEVSEALERLKKAGHIDSRKVGKVDLWYALEFVPPKKVLIVEDDENISKLMRFAVGSDEREIKEVSDGESALKEVDQFKPDVIILDLMLPGSLDGLEICKRVKKEQQTKDTIIVIVSAADAAVNRFFGIQYGADYYLKKPFDPLELKALVNIFLRKRGFDPLIDIPDVKRLIKTLRKKLDAGTEFTKVEIAGFPEYQEAYSKKDARRIIRLVSQMLQDKIKDSNEDVYIAYLEESDFIVAAKPGVAGKLLEEVEADFKRVASFIKQKYKLGGDLFEKLKRGREGGQRFALSINHYAINMDAFKQQFETSIQEIEEAKDLNVAAVQNYSLEQIRKLFEDSQVDVDVKVEEVGGHVRITAGRKEKK